MNNKFILNFTPTGMIPKIHNKQSFNQKIFQLHKLSSFVLEPYYLVQIGLFGVIEYEIEKNYNNFELTEIGLYKKSWVINQLAEVEVTDNKVS